MQERDCVAEVASVMGIMRNLSHTVTPKTYLQLPGGWPFRPGVRADERS